MSVTLRFHARPSSEPNTCSARREGSDVLFDVVFQRNAATKVYGMTLRGRPAEKVAAWCLGDDSHSMKRLNATSALLDVLMGAGVARESVFVTGIPEATLDEWFAPARAQGS